MNHTSKIHDEFSKVQRKTFTKYASNLLVSNGYSPLTDIVTDLKNGLPFIDLMNCLRSKKKGNKGPKAILEAPEQNPKNLFQCYSNINAGIQRITKDGVPLINIDAESIYAGNEKLVLGLIWTLICKYTTDDAGGSVRVAIMDYINNILAQHHDKFKIDKMMNLLEPAMLDGRVMKVMNYHYLDDEGRKNLSEYENSPCDSIKHFDDAMSDANQLLNIPILLEGKDMPSADEKSVITQLLMYKEFEASRSQEDVLREKLRNKISKKQEAKQKARKLDSLANDLISWITERSNKLSSFPTDASPVDVEDQAKFINKHFKVDKPTKADEYNKILTEVSKFKFDCETDDIIAPPVRAAALVAAWNQMMNDEKFALEKLSKLKSAYLKVNVMLREFEHMTASTTTKIKDLNANLDHYGDKAKLVTINKLADLDIFNETLKSDLEDINADISEIKVFVEKNISPICPNKKFEEHRFHHGIEKLVSSAEKCESRVKDADKIFSESQKRCNESREVLKKLAYKMKRMHDALSAQEAFALHLEPYNSLEEFEASTESSAYKDVKTLENLMNDIKDLIQKNASILGLDPSLKEVQHNPYSQLHLDDQIEKYNSVHHLHNTKSEFDQKEKDRLLKSKDIASKIIETIENFNKDIDSINNKVEALNQSLDNKKEDGYDSAISKLKDMRVSLTELQPTLDRITKAIEDTPDIQTDVLMVRSKLDSSIESINGYINGIEQARGAKEVGEDLLLTTEETKNIEKSFKQCDTHRSGSLDFEDFFSCLFTYPPMGIKKMDRNSKEMNSFFKQYSPNGSHIKLDAIKNLYADCKRTFIINSKDAVVKMLKSAADDTGLISKEKLVTILGDDYFKKIESDLSVTTKNGIPSFDINELI